MSKILAGLALATLAGAASAQTVTFSVIINPGPVGNGALVTGSVHVVWTPGASGASGLAGGQFRLAFNDSGHNFTTAGITAPLGTSGGTNGVESTRDNVGVPAGELPAGAGTSADRWTLGRRPKRQYLADASDPASATGGGGFRFPGLGTGPTDLAYTAENQGGVIYLTGRNGAGTENRIEFAQTARGVNLPDPLFYESQRSFDLFKFQIRTPATGAGVISILPDVAIATLYVSDQGAQVTPVITSAAGGVAYSPSPSTLALLGLGGLVAGRRRR